MVPILFISRRAQVKGPQSTTAATQTPNFAQISCRAQATWTFNVRLAMKGRYALPAHVGVCKMTKLFDMALSALLYVISVIGVWCRYS